jgi:membrane fusion protein, heavy metal efflux system
MRWDRGHRRWQSSRVVDIKARLGDDVRKGQLLLKVQSPDITNAFDVYLKALNDEQLANKADVRAKDLYEHGAIPLAMLEQADDTENDAKADLKAAEEQLDTLGVDKAHPTPIVNVYALISGVIIAQNVTNAAAAGVTYSGSPPTFTIADLSVVWILCDVYENDLPKIAFGQSATIRTNAYPDKVLTGRISDIEPAGICTSYLLCLSPERTAQPRNFAGNVLGQAHSPNRTFTRV